MRKQQREIVATHYWQTPVTIKGIEIHLTPEGCRYYRDHYTELLQHTKNAEHHEYIKKLLDNCNQYLQLYKSQKL